MPIVPQQVVVVSHRLPIEVLHKGDETETRPSPGGLARALTQVLSARRGVWIGTPGTAEGLEPDPDVIASFPYRLVSIPLDEDDLERYYRGFANQVLWPLFHDMHKYCDFDESYWRGYEQVNRRFARAVYRQRSADLIWIHDYHLMLVPGMLRALGDERRTGFFLHTPFPAMDLVDRLPWHRALLESLLKCDVIGFQSRRDLENFFAAAKEVFPDLKAEPEGSGLLLAHGDRQAKADVFPVSIDPKRLRERALTPQVEASYQRRLARLGEDRTTIIGVERLDYTKGVPERLRAFEQALELYPDLRGRVVLVQHLDPSRELIPRYRELRREVEALVKRINTRFGTTDWTPIDYSYRHLEFADVLALYRLGDVALVTPLRDGMNLVAKEYCAVNADGNGVLVLSRHTGAAAELGKNALLVDPRDTHQMARAIHTACEMDAAERQARMAKINHQMREHDVQSWAASFLASLSSARRHRVREWPFSPAAAPATEGPWPNDPRTVPMALPRTSIALGAGHLLSKPRSYGDEPTSPGAPSRAE